MSFDDEKTRLRSIAGNLGIKTFNFDNEERLWSRIEANYNDPTLDRFGAAIEKAHATVAPPNKRPGVRGHSAKKKQRDEVLAFVRTYIEAHGRAPLQKEIGVALGIAQSSAGHILWSLAKGGRIKFDPLTHRGIRLVDGKTAPAPSNVSAVTSAQPAKRSRVPLTPRRKEMLNFIGEYIAANGCAPTQKEIGAAMGCNLSGTGRMLAVLARLGRIKIERNTPRGISLAGSVAAKCGASLGSDGAACGKTAMVNGRCRLHGGKSTGPKTPEGRARIADAQRARWQRIGQSMNPASAVPQPAAPGFLARFAAVFGF